jgi:hypothetical protein
MQRGQCLVEFGLEIGSAVLEALSLPAQEIVMKLDGI